MGHCTTLRSRETEGSGLSGPRKPAEPYPAPGCLGLWIVNLSCAVSSCYHSSWWHCQVWGPVVRPQVLQIPLIPREADYLLGAAGRGGAGAGAAGKAPPSGCVQLGRLLKDRAGRPERVGLRVGSRGRRCCA